MKLQLIGAALLALLIVLPALVRRFDVMRFAWGELRPGPVDWRSAFGRLLVDETGAVSVLYYLRGGGVLINGSATAPTAIQASMVYSQRALISMADSDTQALFTHNWGLETSNPTYFELEILGPVVQGVAQVAQTYMPAFTFDMTNTNVLKMNKLNFLGTGGTYLLGLRKPHSTGA